MIKIHAQHGGFSVIIGHPGVGKSVIRTHLEQLGKARDTVVVSFTQTLHTYQPILKQLAESMQVNGPIKDLEKELIHAAYRHVQSQKTLYTVIDEAHLLEMTILRKLRLLFDRFPKKHNLVLLGHPELMYRLSMMCNEDIKSRISYSKQIVPLSDDELNQFSYETKQSGSHGTLNPSHLKCGVEPLQVSTRFETASLQPVAHRSIFCLSL